jgi:hypothetical protein
LPLFARPRRLQRIRALVGTNASVHVESGAKTTRLRGGRSAVTAIPASPDIARRPCMVRFARDLIYSAIMSVSAVLMIFY